METFHNHNYTLVQQKIYESYKMINNIGLD